MKLRWEPVAVAAAVVALVHAVAACLTVFGVYTVTADQQTAIDGVILALVGVPAVLFARAKVIPLGKLNALTAAIELDKAVDTYVPPGVEPVSSQHSNEI